MFQAPSREECRQDHPTQQGVPRIWGTPEGQAAVLRSHALCLVGFCGDLGGP